MNRETTHSLRGVDHTAFVTFEPGKTVRFYRDVLGLPLTQAICAAGWGPAPNFVHFFFDIGNGDQIAFFYYFGQQCYEDVAVPPLLKDARHLALRVETLDELDEYERRLRAGGFDPYMRVKHESIESIYVYDPNGLNLEITRRLREADDADRVDAEFTVASLLEVVAADDEPSLAKLWKAKGRIIVETLGDGPVGDGAEAAR